jgi:hypothetical protein
MQVGGGDVERLRENRLSPISFNGAASSSGDTGKLSFATKRAQLGGGSARRLNPDRPNGSPVYLPDDAAPISALHAGKSRCMESWSRRNWISKSVLAAPLDEGRVQLSITGKGGKVRQVLQS